MSKYYSNSCRRLLTFFQKMCTFFLTKIHRRISKKEYYAYQGKTVLDPIQNREKSLKENYTLQEHVI